MRSVEVSASDLYTTASFSALTENLNEVLELYAGVLTEPAFAPDRIALAKGGALEGIRRENDDPVGIAVREFYRRLAAGHPAGYVPTAETVVGDFRGAHFKGASSEATMHLAAGKRVMQTVGADGNVADFSVDWVV